MHTKLYEKFPIWCKEEESRFQKEYIDNQIDLKELEDELDRLHQEGIYSN